MTPFKLLIYLGVTSIFRKVHNYGALLEKRAGYGMKGRLNVNSLVSTRESTINYAWSCVMPSNFYGSSYFIAITVNADAVFIYFCNSRGC